MHKPLPTSNSSDVVSVKKKANGVSHSNAPVPGMGRPAWLLVALLVILCTPHAGSTTEGILRPVSGNTLVTAVASAILPSDFMTNMRDISLASVTMLLLMALGWSVVLRRKLAEQTIKIREQLLREVKLEKRYQNLFENANDIVFTLDAQGNFITLNQSGETITGYSRQQAAALSFKDLVAPKDTAAFDAWLRTASHEAKGLRCELEIVGKGGQRSILEVNARPVLENEKLSSIEGIARDITQRKKMEDALRESEERFASAFRVSPVAIAIIALEESRFELVNESFLKFLKYEQREVIGHTFSELGIWSSQDERLKVDLTLQEHNSVGGIECRFRTRTGETRTALVFMEKLAMACKPCALFCAYDMTERLNLESQLRQAQKMEAIGRLAAGVAHDFNNLLTVIQGNIELSRMKSQITPELDRSMEQVSTAAQKAAGLVRQLLTFSRKQVLQPVQLDLNSLISGSTKMLKHLLTANVQLKLGFAQNLPFLTADATMLEQIIMNLVVNARDAMFKGGEITICTTVVQVDKAYVQQHPDAMEGKSICLSVTDTGSGMDAVTQARVFEPFFTTKGVDKGTGLGLATVYGIVKQHRGWIELYSVVGRGTTFKVFFPLDQNLGNEAPAAAKAKREGRQTILVVEDDLAVAEFVRATLQGGGFHVLTAGSSLEALGTWNDHAGEIDILLTDLMMPKGMSGMELAENLKALRSDLKVIYTSGYSVDEIQSHTELKEGLNYLAKPYPPPRLLQTVRACANCHPESLAA